MTTPAQGQAIEMGLVVHSCWLGDAEHASGEPAVVAYCGEWASPDDVHETDAPVDCMTCLVAQSRYDRGSDDQA